MAISVHKCPVCDGEGTRNGKTCHGCNGKGYVEVHAPDEPKKASKKGMTKYGKKQ